MLKKIGRKTAFVPRFVFTTVGAGMSVVPILAVAAATTDCSSSPGPVIYPAMIDSGKDAAADGESDAAVADEAEDVDANDDGPPGPVIYPRQP